MLAELEAAPLDVSASSDPKVSVIALPDGRTKTFCNIPDAEFPILVDNEAEPSIFGLVARSCARSTPFSFNFESMIDQSNLKVNGREE